MIRTWLGASLLSVCCVLSMWAQQATTTAANTVVPQLVNFSGVLTDLNGKPLTGVVGTTFLLYKEEQGGAPLWLETQNVQPDKTGHYTVMLGSTTSTGLPTDIFVAGEARWLGVQPQGQTEQPRVMLLSVPYALKAVDAQTVGGLPPSAFVLAAPATSASSAASSAAGSAPNVAPPLGGSGTVNFIPIWTDSSGDLGNSVLFQLGTGSAAKLGINTTKPASALDVKGGSTIRGLLSLPATGVATATKGANSQPLDLAASAFNSGTSAPVTQTFQWQAEPTGNNTSSPSGTLNLLFGSGTSKPAETGLNIASNGQITFSPGQTFPGTGNGTITGVTTAGGSGLTGGGTTGNLNLALTNACVANQVLQWSGSAWVCSNAGTGTITGVFGGTDLTGNGTSGAVTLNLDTTKVPQLATANNFQATQTVSSGDVSISSGNLDLPQTGGGNVGVITMGGATFIHACCANSAGNTSVGVSAGAFNGGASHDTATGFQALLSTSSTDNTANGYQALVADGQGKFNTAVGSGALLQNTAGSYNTGIGTSAGFTNTTAGSHNTLLGASADVGSDGLTNATAIGANAQVTTNNALVLGSIAGVNNATASTNVGIGTTAPAYTLDVHGPGNFTGLITFAPNQTFPGAGTITGVNTPAGSGLTGGGTSGTLNLGLTNSCSSGQVLTWSGSAWTCTGLSGGGTITGVTAGTGLTGGGTGGTVTLNVDPTQVPLVVTLADGHLTVTNPFVSGSTQTGSVALGFAGAAALSDQFSTATGYNALYSSTSGGWNTAYGSDAAYSNSSGANNTATGYNALYYNSVGQGNTATGSGALATVGGNENTGIGYDALSKSEGAAAGNYNTASGSHAGQALDGSVKGSSNTFLGAYTITTQGALNNVTAVGANAEVAVSNAMVLGSIKGVNGASASTSVGIGTTNPTSLLHVGNAGGSSIKNYLRVDGPTAAGTGGTVASFGGYGQFNIDAPGVPGGRLVVTENGQVGIDTAPFSEVYQLSLSQSSGHAIANTWEQYSSRRWKTNIQTLHGALEKVEKLRGVSYDMKESGQHQIGVIAEEVGEVVPEVVTYEKNGKDAQGVDYSRLTALLIEATKEQQALIRKQEEQIRKQQRQMKAQQAQIETQEMQMKTQLTQIARLASQVNAIQTSLKARNAPSSEVQSANAQRPLLHQ